MLKHLGYYHIESFRDEAISNDWRAELVRHLTLPSPELTKSIILPQKIPEKRHAEALHEKAW